MTHGNTVQLGWVQPRASSRLFAALRSGVAKPSSNRSNTRGGLSKLNGKRLPCGVVGSPKQTCRSLDPIPEYGSE